MLRKLVFHGKDWFIDEISNLDCVSIQHKEQEDAINNINKILEGIQSPYDLTDSEIYEIYQNYCIVDSVPYYKYIDYDEISDTIYALNGQKDDYNSFKNKINEYENYVKKDNLYKKVDNNEALIIFDKDDMCIYLNKNKNNEIELCKVCYDDFYELENIQKIKNNISKENFENLLYDIIPYGDFGSFEESNNILLTDYDDIEIFLQKSNSKEREI